MGAQSKYANKRHERAYKPYQKQKWLMIPSTQKTRLKRIVEPLNAIQQKRQDFFTNAQQLYERLRQFAGQARTAIKRAYQDKHQTERADTEINHSQSLFDQSEQAIAEANRQIDDTERQIKQREQQANELIANQQKILDMGKSFGFGR